MKPTRLTVTATVTILICLLSCAASHAIMGVGSPLILNEYNSVKADEYLKDGKSDTYFGRIEGNGDNWIELVVTADHADIRGWQLCWLEADGEGNGTPVWDPDHADQHQSQGTITFSDAALWSDLRSGTIITISDKDTVETFDLSTDTFFEPAVDDWWIHVCARQETALTGGLVTTVTNIDDDDGAFSVGNSDWELSIYDGNVGDAGTSLVFGPIGEAAANWGGGGVGKDEVGKLEVDPTPYVGNGDFNDGTSSTFGAENIYGGTLEQDFSELRSVVPEPGAIVLLITGLLGIALLRRTASSK